MTKRKTTAQFVYDAICVHGEKYDYSLIIYKNTHTKITIICPEHGEFEQRPNRHLQGDGCGSCAHKRSSSLKLKNVNAFIENATKIHGKKYDYSNVEYTGLKNKVCIVCPTHGKFLQTPNDHIHSGAGCPACGNRNKSTNKRKTQEMFLQEALSIHGAKYDYSQVKYNGNNKPVSVVCMIHGVFSVTPTNHIHNRSGCPKCYSSKGEDTIRRLLIDSDIAFEEQKTFKDCINSKTGAMLRYDFFISSQNTLIEYDGPQHFHPTPIKGTRRIAEMFEKIQERDRIKNAYAAENNIRLIRIPYFVDNINEYLVQYNILKGDNNVL